MTEISNHKRAQRKSLCFQRLREEQLRLDKLFSLLSFPTAISHDRLFNNTASLHHTPICVMVSPHENSSEIQCVFSFGVGLFHTCLCGTSLCIYSTLHNSLCRAPPLSSLSLSLPKCECTDLLMSKDIASSIW